METIEAKKYLKKGHAGLMILKNGEVINYGVKDLDEDFLIYYTGKGLKEIWEKSTESEKQNLLHKSDEDLMKLGYLDKISMTEIKRIIN